MFLMQMKKDSVESRKKIAKNNKFEVWGLKIMTKIKIRARSKNKKKENIDSSTKSNRIILTTFQFH